MVEGYSPNNLQEALKILNEKDMIIYAGGTDLMVKNKNSTSLLPGFTKDLLYVGNLKELKEIKSDDNKIEIGAVCTLSFLLRIESVPEVLKKAIRSIASPAIRNMGTIGGNICNASPAGDTLPILYALDAKLKLVSLSSSREVKIDDFILGPGKTILKNNEILESVLIEKINFNKVFYEKVGARKACAISKVSFTALAKINNEKIEDIRIAVGSVGPKIVREKSVEEILIGKEIKEIGNFLPEVEKIYSQKITPINDQRSTATYRKTVVLRLIQYFLNIELNHISN